MPNISVRNVPQETYDALKRLADRERRSLQQQVLVLLDAARGLAPSEDVLNEAAALRARLAHRQLEDPVVVVREGRERQP